MFISNKKLAVLSDCFAKAADARISAADFLQDRMEKILEDGAQSEFEVIYQQMLDVACVVDDQEVFEHVIAPQKIAANERLAAFIEEYFGAVFAKSVISEDQRSHQASQGFQSHGATILAKLFKPR